jgi:NAD-dependent deacetylase
VTDLSPDTRTALDTLAIVMIERRPLVAFTGAGISTESGIPDYRGPEGLWTKGDEKPFTYQMFMEDVDVQRRWWRELPERFQRASQIRPNQGHLALASLERAGVLGATITQNIDGLHRDAGSEPDRLVELHGNIRTIRCTQCGRVYPTGEFLALHAGWNDPPPCPACGGVVKNGSIAFGQPMPELELRRAFTFAETAGLMLVVGSTLLVNPAARVPAVAKAGGAYLAILNLGETALDPIADIRLEVPSGPALSWLTGRLLAEFGEGDQEALGVPLG